MVGSSLGILITKGSMNLGEHRDYGGSRRIVVTLYS